MVASHVGLVPPEVVRLPGVGETHRVLGGHAVDLGELPDHADELTWTVGLRVGLDEHVTEDRREEIDLLGVRSVRVVQACVRRCDGWPLRGKTVARFQMRAS